MSFTPSSLFASGQAGAWYDPADLTTLFQDFAGTQPVTQVGQKVARVADKSGNAKHLTQGTAACCPTYQLDEANRPYLSFDGTDDYLIATLAMSLPFDRLSAIRQVSWTMQDRIFDGGASSGRLYQNAVSPQLRIFDGGTAQAVQNGALGVGTTGIVIERHAAAAARIAINLGGYVSGDTGSVSPTSLSIGAAGGGSNAAHFRLYGMVTRAGTLTDSEVADLRAWLASRSGVDLKPRRMSRHSNWW